MDLKKIIFTSLKGRVAKRGRDKDLQLFHSLNNHNNWVYARLKPGSWDSIVVSRMDGSPRNLSHPQLLSQMHYQSWISNRATGFKPGLPWSVASSLTSRRWTFRGLMLPWWNCNFLSYGVIFFFFINIIVDSLFILFLPQSFLCYCFQVLSIFFFHVFEVSISLRHEISRLA